MSAPTKTSIQVQADGCQTSLVSEPYNSLRPDLASRYRAECDCGYVSPWQRESAKQVAVEYGEDHDCSCQRRCVCGRAMHNPDWDHTRPRQED